MARRLFQLGVAVLLLICLSAIGAVAQSEDDGDVPDDLPGLLDTFGIADQPIDFVVVVDASRSMGEGADPLYPQVKSAYQQFVAAMRPDDHLSVITFGSDDEVVVTPLDPVGPSDSRDSALTALPDGADGSATDIGAALRATLDRLDRPDASEVQVVLFLTDGQHNPDDSSDFSTTSGAAWDQLHDRAIDIEAGHQVLVRGAGLDNGEPTDIGLLNEVFSDAEVVNLSPDRIGAYFQETVDRSRVEVLRAAVERELERPVRVVEAGDQKLDDPSLVTLALESDLRHLPVDAVVEDVSVTGPDGQPLQARLVEGRQEVTIEPGQRSPEITVRVQGVDFDRDTRWFPQTTQTSDLEVQLDVTATVEPQEALQRILGLDATTVDVTGLVDPVEVQRTDGLTWATLVRILIVFMFLALLAFVLYRQFLQVPPLVGFLQYPPDRKTKVPLTGTSQVFPNKRFPVPEAGNARAEFFTRRGKRKTVFVKSKERPVLVEDARRPKQMVPLTGERKLRAGTRLKIGGKEVVYSSAKRKKGK